MFIHLIKLLKNNVFQYFSLLLSWMIGSICVFLWILYYSGQYGRYSFANVRLAELRTSLINGCSNLTNLPCSLQMQIDVYFFLTKFLIFYFIAILIVAVYAWHRTVRFSHCVLALSIVADVIYRTPLVFYFDNLVFSVCVLSLQFFFAFSTIHGIMRYDSDDPMYTLCEDLIRPCMLDECFPSGSSILARFYRWMKRMKHHLGIEEEKLLVTFVIGIVAHSFMIISLIAIMLACGFQFWFYDVDE